MHVNMRYYLGLPDPDMVEPGEKVDVILDGDYAIVKIKMKRSLLWDIVRICKERQVRLDYAIFDALSTLAAFGPSNAVGTSTVKEKPAYIA